MSRTYKDRPNRLKPYNVERDASRVVVYSQYYYTDISTGERRVGNYPRFMDVAGAKRKKKRHYSPYKSGEHWMSTPSWWTRQFMLRPQRTKLNRLTRKALKLTLEALEDLDVPFTKNKPHIYYW